MNKSRYTPQNSVLEKFEELTLMTSIGPIFQSQEGVLSFHPKSDLEITEEGVLDFLSVIAESVPCRPLIYHHTIPHSISFEGIQTLLNTGLLNSMAILVNEGVNAAAARTFLAVGSQFPVRIFEEVEDAYDWSGHFT